MQKSLPNFRGVKDTVSEAWNDNTVSYQFNHVEVFARRGPHRKNSRARKNSMWDIRDEMVRSPHACSHVTDPKPPNVVFGMHPNAAFAMAADRAGQAVDKIGRRLRPEALVVLVGVATWPVTTAEVGCDPQALNLYLKWRAATIRWLQAMWGDLLTSVVEHLDEERPHLHYIVVPEIDSNRHLRIESVHAGFRAATECEQAGGTPPEQKQAYQREMMRFQDAYYYEVGARFGLTRKGPRRQRLTRAEWLERKREAEVLAKAYARLENDYSTIKAKAREYVAEKAAVTDAAAQSRINDVMMQSRHDITTLKLEANRRMTVLRDKKATLTGQIEQKDAVIVAQAEQLTQMRELLAQHGIEVGWST